MIWYENFVFESNGVIRPRGTPSERNGAAFLPAKPNRSQNPSI